MFAEIYKKKYYGDYVGKFLNIDGAWVELIDVFIYDNSEPLKRHLDYALDSIGNQWWIKNELEPALAAGKILPRDKLPRGAKVLAR